MKSYKKIIALVAYFCTAMRAQDISENDVIIEKIDKAPIPIKAPELVAITNNLTIPEDGIKFHYNNSDDTTGRYWQKTDTSSAFAYLDDLLYNNVIESKEQLALDKTYTYLGHFKNEQLKTIYLYGICEDLPDEDQNIDEEDSIN